MRASCRRLQPPDTARSRASRSAAFLVNMSERGEKAEAGPGPATASVALHFLIFRELPRF